MADTNGSTRRKRRLGRGLSSLIVNSSPAQDDPNYVAIQGSSSNRQAAAEPIPHGTRDAGALGIAIDAIAANPYQPRREFNPEALTELTESIRRQGVLQPLIVCSASKVGGDPEKPYVLIAGERRLRAARLAGMESIPCIVRDASQDQMLEWALVENIQREDLNPIERAQGYRQYMDRFNLTQAQVGERVGQPRATIANHLRLLDLCDEAQGLLAEGLLTFGHGKVLAGMVGDVERQVALARKTAAEGLSVRELEEEVAGGRKRGRAGGKGQGGSGAGRAKAAHLVDLEEQLSHCVGTRVKILPGRAKHSGRIVIDYYSLDDFDRIAGALGLREGV